MAVDIVFKEQNTTNYFRFMFIPDTFQEKKPYTIC